MAKNTLRPILIVGLLVTVAVGGTAWWRLANHEKNNDVLVLYSNVDLREVDLAINGSERINVLLVEEGDRIHKGQLLAKLQTERLQYAVGRAQAQVQTQQQVVNRLEAGTRPEEIRQAQAQAEAAKAIAYDAQVTYQRTRDAFEASAATQRELDDAQAKRDAATAQVHAAQAALDLAIAGPRKEDIAEAKALLKRYEAELAIAEHDLEDASLVSPCEGVVRARLLEVGDMASPQKAIFNVALTDPLWVRAYVSEPDLGKIRPGMKATVHTDSFPDKTYDGWIGFISPTAEFTPKPVETREVRTKLVYEVRVFVKNPNNELRLGMPATVNISLHQRVADGQNINAHSQPLEKQ